MNNPQGPRTPILGLHVPEAIQAVVFGPENPIISVLGPFWASYLRAAVEAKPVPSLSGFLGSVLRFGIWKFPKSGVPFQHPHDRDSKSMGSGSRIFFGNYHLGLGVVA